MSNVIGGGRRRVRSGWWCASRGRKAYGSRNLSRRRRPTVSSVTGPSGNPMCGRRSRPTAPAAATSLWVHGGPSPDDRPQNRAAATRARQALVGHVLRSAFGVPATGSSVVGQVNGCSEAGGASASSQDRAPDRRRDCGRGCDASTRPPTRIVLLRTSCARDRRLGLGAPGRSGEVRGRPGAVASSRRTGRMAAGSR
jgi:hypothetical protein